jgi:hypothetical protein
MSATVQALAEAPDASEQRLAPVIDRLAVLSDGVSAVHSSLEQVAGAVGGLRGERTELTTLLSQANERLDQLAASTDELRTNRSDLTSSLQVIADLVESVQAATANTDERIAALGEVVQRNVDLPQADSLLAPLHDDLIALTQRVSTSEGRFDDVLAGIALAVDQIEQVGRANVERSTAFEAQLGLLQDHVRDQLMASSDQQASALRGMVARLEAAAADAHAARVAADAARQAVLEAAEAEASAAAAAAEQPVDDTTAVELAALRSVTDQAAGRAKAATEAAMATSAAVTVLMQRIDAQPELRAVVDAGLDARFNQLTEWLGSVVVELTTTVRTGQTELAQALANPPPPPPPPPGVDPAQLDAALARTSEELRARIDANATASTVDAHLAELGQRVTTLTDGLAATLDSLDNMGARLNEVQVAVAAAASQPPVPAGLDAGQLDAALARTTDELRSRLDAVQQDADAAATRVDLQTDRVLEQLAASSPVRREDLERVDAGLVDIRGRINQLSEVADSVNALRNAAAHQPDLSVYVNPLGAVLQEVRADMQGTRAELVALSRTVSDIRSEARRGDQEMGGAGAALVASAAAAMARLEGRIDNEFDAVSRQMEALGTLVSQAIESVHRMESQVVGVQPVSERVRTAAASVLDSLRNTSRHRSPLRYGNSPPNELEE